MEFEKRFQNVDLALAGLSYYEKEEDVWTDVVGLADDGYEPYDDNIEEGSFGWEEDTAENVMSCFLAEAEHYLVFARGCRWNGASRYKFARDYNEVIERGYEFSLYPISHTEDYSVLVCKEHSHDVPMGSTTIIVALTDDDFEKLSGSSFESVQKFAEEKEQLA